MPLNPSATELTTAATDAALGLLCVALSSRLLQIRVEAAWKRALWVWVLALLALASFLGAAAHGLDLSSAVRALLWLPLYFSLGLTVALFLVGGVYDWRGESTARAVLPWALAVALSFFLLTQLLGGAFLIFVAHEGVAMLAALAIYLYLAASGRLAGAGIVTAGIGLSIVAAAVQASTLSVRFVVPFDHNGLFHLIQLIAIAALGSGLRRGLETATPQPA
jgi:hypothetical protein